MYLQRGFPVALKVADITLMLLSLAMGLHVHVEISCARIRGVTHLAYKRLLSGMRQQMPFQCLIRVKALVANLTVRHVFLIVLLLVQTQIVPGDLRDAAYVAGEAFVVLLQVGFQELLGFEALAAENTLERSLLLVHLDHMLLQFLLVSKSLVTFFATVFDLLALLVPLSVLQEQLFPRYSFPADITLVNRLAIRIALVQLFLSICLMRF